MADNRARAAFLGILVGLCVYALLAGAPDPRLDTPAGSGAAAPAVDEQAPELRGHRRTGGERTAAVPEAAPPSPVDAAPGREALVAADAADRLAKASPHDAPRPDWRPEALGDPALTPAVGLHEILDAESVASGGRRRSAALPWHEQVFGAGWQGLAEVVTQVTLDTPSAPESGAEDEAPVTVVTGKVLAPSGAPLTGAEVLLWSSFYEPHVAYSHHVREIGRAVTDPEGRYTIRAVRLDTLHFGRDGEVLMLVRHPLHPWQVGLRAAGITPEATTELAPVTLAPAQAVLHGRLVDLQGEPVVGGVVRVSGGVNPVLYDKQERFLILDECPTAITDEKGNYRVAGFAPGTHWLSIHVGNDSVYTNTHELRVGETRWDQSLRAGGVVTGRVIDAHGEPLADTVIWGGQNSTHSFADGSFRLENILPGPFSLLVAHHAWHVETVNDIRAGQEDVEIVLARPLSTLELRVSTPEGRVERGVASLRWDFEMNWMPPWAPASPIHPIREGRLETLVPSRVRGVGIAVEGFAPQYLPLADLRSIESHEIALVPITPEAPGG